MRFATKNIRSIKYAMRSDDPAGSKFKRVCTDLPNTAVLIKIATPGDIQVTKTVTDFALVESLKVKTVVSIDFEPAFADDVKNIRLLTTEVILCATAGDLKKKKLSQLYIQERRSPPAISDGGSCQQLKTAAEALLNISTEKIHDNGAENNPGDTEEDEYSGSDKKNVKEKAKTRSEKVATTRDGTAGIADECNDVLTFLQAVSLKAPQVLAAPLLLQVNKRASGWLCQWVERHLTQHTNHHKTRYSITLVSRESLVKSRCV